METRKPGSAQSDDLAGQFDLAIEELDNLDTAPHADEPIPFRVTAWGEWRLAEQRAVWSRIEEGCRRVVAARREVSK